MVRPRKGAPSEGRPVLPELTLGFPSHWPCPSPLLDPPIRPYQGTKQRQII